MRIVAAFLLAALANAQSELPREVLDLAHIRAKMRDNLARVPRYTCLETIERSHRAPRQPEFHRIDRLRFDVTTIGDQEFYSWPGAPRFDGDSLDLVGSGAISDGEFTAHANNVFLNPATQVQFAGEESFNGRRALKYDFQLAAFASHWTIRYADRSGIVAERGSFWADAATLDLLRLEVHAFDIPLAIRATAAAIRIDYGKVEIGGVEILLPRSAQMQMTEPEGDDRNAAEFSECRPYTTESELRFGDSAPDVPPARSAVPPHELRSGVDIAIELTEPIDSRSAVEGDAITARTAAEVRATRRVLIPKGATVRGRIRRLETYSDPVPHFIVGLEFFAVESGANLWKFRGALERADPVAGFAWTLSTKRGEFEDFGRRFGTQQEIKGQTLSTTSLPGVGTFFMEGAHFRLPVGFHMLWRSVGR